MNNEIREPVQERSIEKKNKIIECGFKLICEKGYYNTNTAEIAKASNVSTGIVYQYFKDKRDILLAGIKLYAGSIFCPSFSDSENNLKNGNLYDFFSEVINEFIKNHKSLKKAHEWITEVAHSDKEIAEIINNIEFEYSNKLVDILEKNGYSQDNLKEKAHISIHLIEDLCHEIVYHKHSNMDYDIMKEQTIKALCYLIEL